MVPNFARPHSPYHESHPLRAPPEDPPLASAGTSALAPIRSTSQAPLGARRLGNLREAAIGATLLVIDDGDELLAACRQAGIPSTPHHRHNLAALGKPVCVQVKNPDGTVLCKELSTGISLWLPTSALINAEWDDIT